MAKWQNGEYAKVKEGINKLMSKSTFSLAIPDCFLEAGDEELDERFISYLLDDADGDE
jgi:hypothetical protein